ncbi:hypothetical protein DSO57_1014001 [Entomophthora muscae]|uniref:Uncharacterized protein n=1 Tax=Entomophthora muscae TaxID=34485 RepID=A0ACC2TTD1_9FUNG|nr:hypothetical protein DSO57_1014001 [Entomophthora muscae]
MPRLTERGWIFANGSRALMEEFGSEEALNNHKTDFVKGGIKKDTQTPISLKAASFIDVKAALLNTLQSNKNLSLALKSGIYGAHNVSELICHLFTFKDNFEIPIPNTIRASQENRYRPTTTENEKSKSAAITSATSSEVASVPRTGFKCEKPGHMSRKCKQKNAKIHHIGADEYNYKEECEEEEATQDKEPKNC